MVTPRFVLDLRRKIGHDPLWMSGVKGVVVRRTPAGGGEVLLVRRADNGRWTVPAGIIEPGEEPGDAIEREVEEETGVQARVTRLVGVSTTQPTVYPNGDQAQYLDVVMALEAVDPFGGQERVNDDENLAVQWRDVEDLEDVPPLHVRAIEWTLEQDARFSATPATGARYLLGGEVRGG